MVFYKKVKFPFEVTKGKSQDLYRLRFMRKSELEPGLRHNLKYSVCQMDRQLDLWFKQQLFTIGSLNREQDKIHKSRKRLKIEIRQCKKREYAKRQEEIREKLEKIRIKMLMMKVLQKFRDNVQNAREYRQAEIRGRENIDLLHVSGNKQPIHSPRDEQKSTKPDVKDNRHHVKSSGDNKHPNEVDYHKENPVTRRKIPKRYSSSEESEDSDDSIETPRETEHNDMDYTDPGEGPDQADNQLFGQRYPSSHGQRMETIPEEREDVELDVEIEGSIGNVGEPGEGYVLHLSSVVNCTPLDFHLFEVLRSCIFENKSIHY